MSDLKSYFNVVNLLLHAEKNMGLDSMTESDREILLSMWNKSNNGKSDLKITYEDLPNEDQINVSRAQFYKTLRKATDLQILERIGTPRSATYRWLLKP